MKVKVKISGKRYNLNLSKGSKIIDLLEILNLNRETVVVKKNGSIVPEEERIGPKDKIEILTIISGG